jgi:hypothetical protein
MITVGTTVVSGSPINGGGGGAPSGTGVVTVTSGVFDTPSSTDDVVMSGLSGLVGGTAGQAVVGDGAGSIQQTSADVSTLLGAADAAAARAAIGVEAARTRTSGTLAARPASPVAGDTYDVTSGDATGDCYECFVAGTWRVVHYTRDARSATSLEAEWLCDNVRQAGAYTLSNVIAPGTYDLSVGSAVYDSAGGPGVFGRAIVQPTADVGTSANDYRKGAGTLEPASITILAWVIMRALPPAYGSYVLVKRVDDSDWAAANTFSVVGLAVNSLGVLAAETRTAANVATLTGIDPLLPGAPSLVALTFDNATTTAALWLNGTPQGSLNRSAALSYGSAINRSWALGGNFSSTGAAVRQRFPGSVERVRVYSRVLTAAEMIEIYQRGIGTYEGQ